MSKVGIVGVEKYVPGDVINTKEMLDSFSGRFSRDLRFSLKATGAANRYSVMKNYPQYLSGQANREFQDDTNTMLVKVIEKLHTKHAHKFKDIGLFLSATDTANRPMPCTAYEVVASLKENYFEKANIINIQNQGCSVLLKMVDIARDYIAMHPGKYVLLTLAEAHTGLVDSLSKEFYEGFISLKKKGELHGDKFRELESMIGSFLFGDGAVGFLLGAEDQGEYCFGTAVHCTNRRSVDKDLLSIDEGGILIPEYDGFPHYSMSKTVPERGARYAEITLGLLGEALNQEVTEKDYDKFFIHTGSKKIINGVCDILGMDKGDERAHISYDILNNYANLSAVSIPMMLVDTFNNNEPFDRALLLSFGVGFSASSGILTRS